MSAHFMLECFGPDEVERAGIDTVHGLDGLNWMLGKPFAQPIATPVRITMDADEGMMLPLFNRGILLMRDDLLAAFAGSGVDNLDCYDTELFNPANGERFTNYKAVNIIGVVAAADLGKSDCQVYGKALFDVDFDSLVLDPQKTHGLLVFRLAECVSGIVVHESVRRTVERRGIQHLDWVPPEAWIG